MTSPNAGPEGEQPQATEEEETSTAASLLSMAKKLSTEAAAIASKTVTLVGDLNGDGKVDEEDAKIARNYAASVMEAGAEEAGKLASAVARSPLVQDVASHAAIGAAIAIPVPVVGPALGGAVGAGIGMFQNLKRKEPGPLPAPIPPDSDPITELERLSELRDKGILTEEEFQREKRKLLK